MEITCWPKFGWINGFTMFYGNLIWLVVIVEASDQLLLYKIPFESPRSAQDLCRAIRMAHREEHAQVQNERRRVPQACKRGGP